MLAADIYRSAGVTIAFYDDNRTFRQHPAHLSGNISRNRGCRLYQTIRLPQHISLFGILKKGVRLRREISSMTAIRV